jgi:hypothetical protein
VQEVMNFSARTIVVALVGGSLAVFANMLALIMVGQVNLKVPEKERIRYSAWGMGIGKRHKQLYPESKLSYAFNLCCILLVICIPIGLWSIGFFDQWPGHR